MSSDDYKQLVMVVLARIILFNAKRGGEAGRMLLENFQTPLNAPEDDFGLSALEKKLTSR